MFEFNFVLKFIILCFFIIFISTINLFQSKHVLHIFIFLELILVSFTLVILAIAHMFDDINGIILALFLFGLIASETALGFILIICLQKYEFLII